MHNMKIKRKLVQICLLFAVPLQAIICDAQTLQTLYSFNSGQISPNPNLTLGPDGNLYGTTYGDANGDYGTVFRLTTNGTITTMYSLGGNNGQSPRGSLTLGNDGNFYGTTSGYGYQMGLYFIGGQYGTVFRITTNEASTTIATFNSSDGQSLVCGLTWVTTAISTA